MLNTETVLITGASSGIGLHLAREFAAHGHSLILVAPVEAELRAIAAELSQGRDIKVISIPKDLEQPHAAEEIFDELQAQGIAVDILVNNAGHGFYGRWWEQSIEKDLSMLRLNVEAALWLTKLFLKPMLQRGKGRILNTASVASFEPGPLMSVYHATKAFLLSWTEALAMELEDTPITVTVLCPGATDTDFFPKAGMVGSRIFQKGNLMAPQEVAKAGYAGVMQGELFVIPGALNKAMVAARRILPESAQARVNQKLYETIPADEQKRHRGDIEKAAQD